MSHGATQVRRDPLRPDEIDLFQRQGYLVVGRVLEREATKRLKARLPELRSSSEAVQRERNIRVTRYGESGLSVLFNLWRADPAFRGLLFDRRLAAWAAQLLGCGSVSLMSDETMVKLPGDEGYLDWHQDWVGYPEIEPHFVTCWIALDDVAPANGTLELAPGSHRLGPFLPREEETGWDPRLEAHRARGLRPLPGLGETDLAAVSLEVEAGTCSFHYALTWHRSGVNRAGASRDAIAKRFRPVSRDGASGAPRPAAG